VVPGRPRRHTPVGLMTACGVVTTSTGAIDECTVTGRPRFRACVAALSPMIRRFAIRPRDSGHPKIRGAELPMTCEDNAALVAQRQSSTNQTPGRL
jgi:hypothetical protein